eukprot:TRINITY_DN3630_c1_g3_i1.p1 TRINITY_DN3630_c1_g3~~TRINITY_DN3630_c1_g3_i1.p1  ORF type:complete len:845 (+),score=277.93 TRINITY_DN3630_c1_g3_i1:77-2611(+)
MEGCHVLEGDGCLPALYYYVWKKKANVVDAVHDIRIPSTVVYGHNFPKEWYMLNKKSGEVERRTGRDITPAAIEQNFCPPSTARRFRDGGVVASYFSGVKGQNGQTQARVEFLDHKALKDFLYHRISRADGILQRFITPEGRHNEVIQVVWSPCADVQLITKRQNHYPHDDRRASMHDRSVTYEGPTHLSREAFLAPHIQWLVKRQCQRFVLHFHSTEQVYVQRMVLHFKVDGAGDLWLLWGSSIRVTRVGKEHPVDLTVKFESAVGQPEVTSAENQPASLLDGSRPEFGTVDEEEERRITLGSQVRTEAEVLRPPPSLGKIGDMCPYQMKCTDRWKALHSAWATAESAYKAKVDAIEAMRFDDETWEHVTIRGARRLRGRGPSRAATAKSGSTPPPMMKEVFRIAPGVRTGASKRLKQLTSTLTLLARARERQRQKKDEDDALLEGGETRDARRGSVWVHPTETAAARPKQPRKPADDVKKRRPALLKLTNVSLKHWPGLKGRRRGGILPPGGIRGPVVYDNEEFRGLDGAVEAIEKRAARLNIWRASRTALQRWASVRAIVKCGLTVHLRNVAELTEWGSGAVYSLRTQFLQKSPVVRLGMSKNMQQRFGFSLVSLLAAELGVECGWGTVRTLAKEPRPPPGMVGSSLMSSLMSAGGFTKNQKPPCGRSIWVEMRPGDVTVVQVVSLLLAWKKALIEDELAVLQECFRLVRSDEGSGLEPPAEALAASRRSTVMTFSADDPFRSVQAMWRGPGDFRKPELLIDSDDVEEGEPELECLPEETPESPVAIEVERAEVAPMSQVGSVRNLAAVRSRQQAGPGQLNPQPLPAFFLSPPSPLSPGGR